MNCQSCGAENEPGARFCAECGAPLEDLRGATQPLDDDSDRTILSTRSELEEDAKTVSVTQDEVAAAAVEVEPTPPHEPEPGSPPPPPASPPPPGGNGSIGGGLMSQRNIIIAIVVLLVLCCCCFFVGLGGLIGSGRFEEIINELSMLSLPLYLG